MSRLQLLYRVLALAGILQVSLSFAVLRSSPDFSPLTEAEQKIVAAGICTVCPATTNNFTCPACVGPTGCDQDTGDPLDGKAGCVWAAAVKICKLGIGGCKNNKTTSCGQYWSPACQYVNGIWVTDGCFPTGYSCAGC